MEDDVVRETRERITEVDRRILEAINERLRLVQELWRHKAEHGIPTRAPGREQWLFDHLANTPVVLGNPTVVTGVGVTHLRYPVHAS